MARLGQHRVRIRAPHRRSRMCDHSLSAAMLRRKSTVVAIAEGVAKESFVPIAELRNPERKGWMFKRGTVGGIARGCACRVRARGAVADTHGGWHRLGATVDHQVAKARSRTGSCATLCCQVRLHAAVLPVAPPRPSGVSMRAVPKPRPPGVVAPLHTQTSSCTTTKGCRTKPPRAS